MSPFEAFFIAVVQGITELFPVSSLGHAILIPRLVGLNIDLHAPEFLPFLVILHLGTAAALLLFLWRDWWTLFLAVIGRGDPTTRTAHLKTLFLLILGTLPAVIVGYGLNHALRNVFASPTAVAVFLFINGFVLYFAESLRSRAAAGAASGAIERMRGRTALVIGTAQALALLPGISRSGVTIAGGLIAGLSHEAAARFSFLLATPIIIGAGVLEVPKLLHVPAGTAPANWPLYLSAGLVAGVVAFASVAGLMHWFRRHEIAAMRPFAYYCWLLGAIAFIAV